MERIAVVGFSLAGLRAAEALRRGGFEGELVVVGEEREPPYDRPPLSKDFLAGAVDVDGIALARQGTDGLGLDARLGQRAVALDVANRSITLDSGASAGGRRTRGRSRRPRPPPPNPR
jgi:3-phenylpropionate/trans-cinnamate dioxygenase ferredoxin reductase component